MIFFNSHAQTAPTCTHIIASIVNDQLIIESPSIKKAPITISLDAHTIHQGVIFKPASLIAQLANYLRSNNLKHPKAALKLPALAQESVTKLPFFVLQYTLAFAKAGFCITQVTVAEQPENLLNLLHQPRTNAPTSWLLLTGLALTTAGFTMWGKYAEISAQKAILTNIASDAQQTNLTYEKQFKETTTLKTTVKKLQETHTATQQVSRDLHNPQRELKALAHYTPPSLWLTTVIINEKNSDKTPSKTKNNQTIKTSSKKSPNTQIIVLKGVSSNAAAISRFLKNLSNKSSGIKKPTLVAVNKEKRIKNKKHPQQKKSKNIFYHFTVEGALMRN